METDERVDRLIAAVRRRIGGKELSEAETQAGVAPGYLRKAQSTTRNVMISKFLRICEQAGLDPAEIFAEAFPVSRPTLDFGIPIPQRSVPHIVRRVRERAALSEEEPHSSIPRHWLEWLDELRFDKPQRALELLESTLDLVKSEDLPLALGVWASTCRLFSRYDEAFLACVEGLELARHLNDWLSEVRLLRRMSFLITSKSAQYPAALNVSEQAMLICVRNGGWDYVGQLLVDQGIIMGGLQRFGEADAAFREALQLLRKGDRRDRVAALLGLGIHCQLRGEPKDALSYIEQASKLSLSRFEQGKIDWLAGCAHADLLSWGDAFEHFEKAVERLLAISPIDAALVVCDHVKALLESGKSQEAQVRAKFMRKLIEPLVEFPIASAAIRDLLRCEMEGQQLTVVYLHKVKKRIEESRRTEARRQRKG